MAKRSYGQMVGPYASGYGVKKFRRSFKKKKSLVAKVNRIIRGEEIKNWDTVQTSTAFDTAGVSYQLSNVSEGDSATSRDGRRLAYKNLRVRFSMSSQGGATGTVRCLIFMEKAASGVVAPTGTTVLLDQNTAALTSASSFINPANFPSRFKLLYDNFNAVYKGTSPTTGVGAAGVTGPIFTSDEVYIPLEGVIATYQTAQGNTQNGSILWIFFIGDATTGNYSFKSRLAFTDS